MKLFRFVKEVLMLTDGDFAAKVTVSEDKSTFDVMITCNGVTRTLLGAPVNSDKDEDKVVVTSFLIEALH